MKPVTNPPAPATPVKAHTSANQANQGSHPIADPGASPTVKRAINALQEGSPDTRIGKTELQFREAVEGGAKGVDVANRTSSGIFTETGSGSAYYRSLDSLGRPVGVDASITQDMLRTGTPANPSITPPGWSGNGTLYNEARGHLLGNQLGGSGDLAENLVTLQQNWTNSPVMRGFESQVRSAVEAGEMVQYSATPIYQGSNLVPKGVTLIGNGSNGFNLGVTVLNPIGF